jgi:hypothetical protein
MALLAGVGLFLMQHSIPTVKNKDRMLNLARMSMNWNVDDIVKFAKQFSIPLNEDLLPKLRDQDSVYTSKEFFELLGFAQYDDIDVHADEGATIIHDMNTPIPNEYHQQFDFINEVGTIEHIFDLKTTMGNISKMLKVGGHVSHVAPLTAFNHGFYNFSLNFFFDFYRVNGFDDMHCYILKSSANWANNQNVVVEPMEYTPQEFDINKEVFAGEYNKLGLGFRARKIEHIEETQVPMQAAYDAELKLATALKNW